jgi:antitoxin (DNA-binding transcriptional repressor) of toxin-antitoxin stability system
MKVNVQYAQTHFPDLASAAYRGEEVEIANPDVAKTLRLVVSDSPTRSETSTIEDTGNSVVEEWRVLNREVERQIAEEATRNPHLFKHHGGPGRLLSESLAILQRRNSSVTIDPDFADDVQAAIDAHREPSDPPSWD